MVHALDSIKELLKPAGLLIDIHPISSPPELFVRIHAERCFIGYPEEKGQFVQYNILAQAALDESVRKGTFRLDHAGQFTFVTHARTLQAFQAYLAENWKDAVLPSRVLRKAAAAFEKPGAEEVLLEEQIIISRLQRGP